MQIQEIIGCDSLSNLYLWHIKYSQSSNGMYRIEVVIRFQICIFDILNTARKNSMKKLWRCDSLSNLYLWHIKYSKNDSVSYYEQVVIRFQICIFDILNTARTTVATGNNSCDSLSNLYLWHIKYSNKVGFVIKNTLWFAFKFVSLTY